MNKELIDKINNIVNPKWIFNMDDFYGDKGGIPYHEIETLDILYWKQKKFDDISKNNNEILDKIRNIPNIDTVKIIKIQAYGIYIMVVLNKINMRLIDKYNKFLLYKENNVGKINKIYNYLECKIPIDFISWNLFCES